MTDTRQKIAVTLLVIGALGGVVLAGAGLLQTEEALPGDAVAVVNGVVLGRDQLDEYVAAINASSRTPKSRDYILGRMVDEELLVQRGVELGFLNLNSTVRNSIVQAMTSRFTAGDSGQAPDDEMLREFFNANLEYFTPPGQYTVTVVSGPPLPLPDKPMTVRTLTQYLGPATAEVIPTLEIDETWTLPASNGATPTVLRLLARAEGSAPHFEAARDIIAREYERREVERAYDDYLVWLRDRADISLAEQ